MNFNENFFKTHDLNISAVLVASGLPLDHIEKQSNGRVLFCFSSSPSIKTLFDAFWKQQITINPQKLFDALKFLKSRLYSDC